MYDIQQIRFPWFGGIGFIQGMPAIRVHIRKTSTSRKLDAHQVAKQIASIAPMRNEHAPRWVAITGETEQADNALKLVLGSTIGKLSYIESNGARSMCDRNDHLPGWDHICLRAKATENPEKIQIFHSIIIDGKPTAEEVAELEFRLGKIAYNGPRYIFNNASNRRIVKQFASRYLLTQPVQIA